ncbi:MAG: hypothetical protein ACXW4B_10405 [Micavibrio sp.]
MRKLIPDSLAIWRREVPALPAPGQPEPNDALRRRLVVDFDRARYGVTFRTCAFPGTVPGETEYFKALATTPDLDRWDVQKITSRDIQMESPDQPVETPNVKLRAAKTGLGFFEALDYLARFESAQTAKPAGASQKDLGNQHYLAFGLLHNIAFNMQGQPQPTIGGHIAISDEYPVAVLAQLEEAQKNTAEKTRLRAQTTVLARANSSAIVAGFSQLQRQAQDHENLKDIHDNYVAVWRDLFAHLFSSSAFVISTENAHRLYLKRHSMDSQCFDNFKNSPAARGDRFTSLYTQSAKSIKDSKLQQQDKVLILSALKEMTVFGLLEDAKRTGLAINKSADNGQIKALGEIAESYAQMGDERKRREHFIAAALSEPPVKAMPEHFLEFFQKMDGLVNGAQKKTQETWSQISPVRERDFR